MGLPCLAAAALAASALSPRDAAQTPPEFRSDVRLIRLDVSVVDGRGRPVAGLRPSDFEVREDGRPVEVTYFEAVSEGASVTSGDGAREVDGRPGDRPRRLLLLVDTGSLTPRQLVRAREAVSGYVDQAREGEWVRLANLSTGEAWDGRMPADGPRLRAAAARLGQRRSPWAQDAEPIVEVVEQGGRGDGPTAAETSGRFLSEFSQAAGLLGALEALLTELEGVPGRKGLVLISRGFPQLGGLDRRLQWVATLAREAATAVYFVDAVGLDGLLPEAGRRMRSPFEMAWARSGGAQDLAEATGGFVSRFGNSLLPALRRVSAEMRTYYVLGFAPSGPEDGRFRSIRVEVKVPGLSVRTKKGYLARP